MLVAYMDAIYYMCPCSLPSPWTVELCLPNRFFYLHTSMILIATARAFKELVDLDHELLVHARRYKGSRLHHPIYRR